jgi:3',5'-cyclic-AMP phosphodiesterase
VTSIAHITDLHLVEHDYARRSAGDRYRLQYLNTGRNIDPARRRDKAVAALRAASRADHVVITGDLTEDGSPAQFESLAEVLIEAGLDPARVTLVPGNHDVYACPEAFRRALQGPLRRYAVASAPGVAIDLGPALLLPICTAVPQSFLRSAGRLDPADAERISALARRKGMLIVAQHHPPLGHRNPLRNWIDGLCNVAVSAALLALHAHLHVLHGHLHVAKSRQVGSERSDQFHCAAAVLQSAAHVRFYEVSGEALAATDGAEGCAAAAADPAAAVPA